MLFATFEYYSENYRGTMLNETDFQNYAIKASYEVDHATFGRLGDMQAEMIPDAAKNAVCEVAEQLFRFDTVADGGSIASENNDGHSVSYRDSGSYVVKAGTIRAIIRKYLAATGLMYRGVF